MRLYQNKVVLVENRIGIFRSIKGEPNQTMQMFQLNPRHICCSWIVYLILFVVNFS